ncbi:MAG: CdaR family protein [Firmicutes bacterium]|nr:CdaR family protein [Bacillota bacterium]
MQSQAPTTNTNFWSQLKRALYTVRRRPFMKLSALLLAFFFWAVVIASDPSLIREKTFTAAVAVQGVETLRSRGYIVMQDLTSEPLTVKMRVGIKQVDYERATAAAFAPRLDLAQQITGAGKQLVKVSAAYESIGSVLSFEPEYFEVDVEPYVTNRVPVVIELAGQCASPIWIGTPLAEPSAVSVSGPKSIVDKIRRAVAELPMNSLTLDRPEDHLTAVIELRDAGDNRVSSPLLRVTNESIVLDSVRIDVTVYPMKEIPVSVETAVVGTPAHGYALGDVRVTPESVRIAASAEVLGGLEVLHVSAPVDVTGQSKEQIASSALRNVTGFPYSSADSVVIEAGIQPATHVHTYIDLPVTVMDVAPGLSARLSQNAMSAVLSGAYQDVESLSAGDIHLYVEATGLSEGVYTVEVKCRVDGTEAYEFEPEFPRLTLTLK